MPKKLDLSGFLILVFVFYVCSLFSNGEFIYVFLENLIFLLTKMLFCSVWVLRKAEEKKRKFYMF